MKGMDLKRGDIANIRSLVISYHQCYNSLWFYSEYAKKGVISHG